MKYCTWRHSNFYVFNGSKSGRNVSIQMTVLPSNAYCTLTACYPLISALYVHCPFYSYNNPLRKLPQFPHLTAREEGSKSSGYLLSDTVNKWWHSDSNLGTNWLWSVSFYTLCSTGLFLQYKIDSDLYMEISTSSNGLWNRDFHWEYQKSYSPPPHQVCLKMLERH